MCCILFLPTGYRADGNFTYNQDRSLVTGSTEIEVNSNFTVIYSYSASLLNFVLSKLVSLIPLTGNTAKKFFLLKI